MCAGVVGTLAAAPLIVACADDRWSRRSRPVDGRARRVGVVGAGIAGIAAARALYDAGHDPIVLEARDRIGGRLHTIELAGAPVELGANWVHGTDDNPLMPLLEQAGVKLVEDHHSRVLVVDAAGRPLTKRARAAALDDARERLERASTRAGELDVDPSLARMLAVESSPSDPTAFVLRTELQNEYSADTSEMSTWWYDEGGNLDGDEPIVAGGFDRIAKLLAAGLDVRTGTRVRRIERRAAGARIHAAGGTQLDVDAVVLAVPIAVLAAESIDIDLGVPDAVIESIGRIGTGTLEKVMLRFEPDEWLPDVGALGTTDPRHVDHGIAEFTLLHGHEAATTVIGLAGGAAAAALARRGTQAMHDAAMDGLRSILGASSVPDPLAWTASTWTTDPLTLGSYSFLRPGGTPDDRRRLCQTFDDRLVLAGEACDPDEPATVHGALRSGRRAARLLLDEVLDA
jgi:monoamine oxidase